jgi:predicted exporter
MTRLALGFLLAVLLGTAALNVVKFETDVADLLGAGESGADALDGVAGRSQTIALRAGDAAQRRATAIELAAHLKEHQLVVRADAGPGAPDPDLLDWLWQHRLLLAPPSTSDVTADALRRELERARAELTSLSGSGLASRYLLDPTGSYRRVIEQLTSAGSNVLPTDTGVWQSLDTDASIVFLQLADLPFDASAQSSLDDEIRNLADANGLEALIVGPRAISAEINNRIALRAQVVAGLGGLLVLVWIAWVMRSPVRVMSCVLPALIGAGAGVLGLHLFFGGVHLLAIGFGGVLVGLAIDYPIHLILHGRSRQERVHATRLVGIGAVTTAVAFLAMLASDIRVLAQTGVFVALGLSTAALASWALRPEKGVSLRPISMTSRPHLKSKPFLVAGLAAIAAIAVLFLPERDTAGLIDVPAKIRETVAELDRMMDLPSGQYRIETTAGTLGALIERQKAVSDALLGLQAQGHITRFRMLGNSLPLPPNDPAKISAAVLAERLPEALRAAGLSPGFATQIVNAYAEALGQPPLKASTVATLVNSESIAGLVQVRGDRLVGPIQLWDVSDPVRVREALSSFDLEGVAFVDEKARIRSGLDRLKFRAMLTVGLGALAGAFVLVLVLRQTRPAIEIVLCTAAATLLAAAIAGWAAGGLGVFHMVALALVIGIGIDYGLFLTMSCDEAQDDVAMQSVLICAVTTLLAFSVMIVSGVELLEHIGLTVVVGVIAALAVSIVLDPESRQS